MYKILGLIKEGSLVGATAKDEFWQGAKVFTLTKLGQNTAMQNSLPAALAFYQGAAEAEPASRRSISLLNHIAACHLAIGDISSFVNVSEEVREGDIWKPRSKYYCDYDYDHDYGYDEDDVPTKCTNATL